jgi:catechol 2,3-dioxygenase-like lactoylglutathione lyase family enzyme
LGVSIHHIDLAVSDVERSLAFYLGLLGPFGMKEAGRFRTYRGTEEVVYLTFGDQYLGLRQADGGEYRYLRRRHGASCVLCREVAYGPPELDPLRQGPDDG